MSGFFRKKNLVPKKEHAFFSLGHTDFSNQLWCATAILFPNEMPRLRIGNLTFPSRKRGTFVPQTRGFFLKAIEVARSEQVYLLLLQ